MRGFRLTRVRGVPCADAALGFGELGGVILPARLSRFLAVVSGFSPVIRALRRCTTRPSPYDLAAFSSILLSFSFFSSKTIFPKAASEKIKPSIPRASILFPPFHCGLNVVLRRSYHWRAGAQCGGLRLTRVRRVALAGEALRFAAIFRGQPV